MPEWDKSRVYVPTATYRLQFHAGFPFSEAERYADYFQRLGVSDIYSSPIWKARVGSMHCYDVVDHSVVNPELGGEAAYKSLAKALDERGLGVVVDVVPNHMGIMDPGNRQWWDVMENGACSPYANFFDIDWRAYKTELHDRVELPVLGAQFGICLERGELKVSFTQDAEFLVHYYDTVLPTGPRTWLRILQLVLDELRAQMQDDDADLVEFESILTALGHLPMRDRTDLCRIRERQREKEVCKRRLRTLLANNPLFEETIQHVLTEVNGDPGHPQSFDILEAFLEDQTYRLSFWRVAGDEINYRRFFDVNELAAIKVELPDVFQHVHSLIFKLIQDGCLRGLRIDHPDGLLNPPQYFKDLQMGCLFAISGREYEEQQVPPQECENEPCAMWVVVEKILEHQERIRPDWAVQGTTGYEFLNLVNGVLVHQENGPAFLRLYSRFVGAGPNYPELKHSCKKLILDISMAGELYTLALKLDAISEQNRRTRDFTLQTLQEALAEFIAAFPVYRSYIRPDSTEVGADDRHYIETAIRTAKKRNPSVDPTIFDFIGVVHLMEEQELLTDEQRKERLLFVLALQQITGPVMAKGLEDTAFYREFPLVSLNEVGGEPERFGVSVLEFHNRCIEQARLWPASMTSTSTHDTKRSEDARARINVLSEIPRHWERAIFRWRRFNNRRKVQVEGHHVPTSHDEYLLYQNLLAIWPLDGQPTPELAERMKQYMLKAVREAKVNTSWVNVNEPYELALLKFTEEVLDPGKSARFLTDFGEFCKLTALRGANNSLAQVLMKITAPGVPDFYQGCELWSFALVDPDNRRPVDYDLRVQMLEEVINRQDDPGFIDELVREWQDGRIKLFVTHKGLAFRRAFQALYHRGNYVPVYADGPAAQRVISYAQTCEGEPWALTIAPRLLAAGDFPSDKLADFAFWNDTRLRLPDGAPARWHNIFTNANVEAKDGWLELSEHLGAFPVALLVSQ